MRINIYKINITNVFTSYFKIRYALHIFTLGHYVKWPYILINKAQYNSLKYETLWENFQEIATKFIAQILSYFRFKIACLIQGNKICRLLPVCPNIALRASNKHWMMPALLQAFKQLLLLLGGAVSQAEDGAPVTGDNPSYRFVETFPSIPKDELQMHNHSAQNFCVKRKIYKHLWV